MKHCAKELGKKHRNLARDPRLVRRGNAKIKWEVGIKKGGNGMGKGLMQIGNDKHTAYAS